MNINLSKSAEIARFTFIYLYFYLLDLEKLCIYFCDFEFQFQELSPDIGLALCELLDLKNDVDGLLTR